MLHLSIKEKGKPISIGPDLFFFIENITAHTLTCTITVHQLGSSYQCQIPPNDPLIFEESLQTRLEKGQELILSVQNKPLKMIILHIEGKNARIGFDGPRDIVILRSGLPPHSTPQI